MWKLLLVVALGFLGFVAGGLIGAKQVPPNAGLAAGATVFVWAAGGALAALILGVVLARQLPARRQHVVVAVLATLAAFGLLWLRP